MVPKGEDVETKRVFYVGDHDLNLTRTVVGRALRRRGGEAGAGFELVAPELCNFRGRPRFRRDFSDIAISLM